MIQQLSKKILFDWLGYQEIVTEPLPEKYIIAMAPHTSNWDFILGNLYCATIGVKCNFMMKKEWFFWPMGIFMRWLGGIPVYRDKTMGVTDVLAAKAIESKTFRLCITPEGTRKPNPDWKKGFYYIAQKADIPILLYGLDYKEKKIECTKTIIPNGDIDSQMAEIKEYFSRFTAKYPQNFKI